MLAFVTRCACCGLLVAALGTIAGCPPQADQFFQGAPDSDQAGRDSPPAAPDPTIFHALSPELTALLNAPPIDAPTAGASALANTRWSGTQDCVLTGDINMLISGPGTNPMSDTLYFDGRGVPSELTGLPYQFKRATFAEDSFDVAGTFVVSMAISETVTSTAYVITLSGRRSADGRTLTGQRRLGILESFDGPAADLAVTYDCTFTLSLVE